MNENEKQLQNSQPDGDHFLVGFFGCDPEQIDSLDFWQTVLPAAIEGSKMEILNSSFYKFDPQGVTGFLLLSSSHLSIHTWPENQYIACDLFTCSGEEDTKKVLAYLTENITHTKIEVTHVKRGYTHE